MASKPRTQLTPSPSPNHPLPTLPALSRTSTNTTTTTTSAQPSAKSPRPTTSQNSTTQDPNEFQVVRSKSHTPAPKIVERNKYGQRVDRLDFKTIPREDLSRIKKLKLCNFYYLQGECPNENCYHDHSRKLTKSERFILVAIARMTPCRYGLECDDPECMYGHRCPQSEIGRKDCYWGEDCRFETVAHGIDTNIVKLTRV